MYGSLAILALVAAYFLVVLRNITSIRFELQCHQLFLVWILAFGGMTGGLVVFHGPCPCSVDTALKPV